MKDRIEFFVPAVLPTATDQQHRITCAPIQIKGKFGKTFTKHVPKVYDGDDLKLAREQLRNLVKPHAPEVPFDCAVTCRILWIWPWRKSEPKKNRVDGIKICDVRPDCGNLSKALEDILEAEGFFSDDKLIGHPEMWKGWGDIPGLGIEIIPCTMPPPSFSNLLHIMEFGTNTHTVITQ